MVLLFCCPRQAGDAWIAGDKQVWEGLERIQAEQDVAGDVDHEVRAVGVIFGGGGEFFGPHLTCVSCHAHAYVDML